MWHKNKHELSSNKHSDGDQLLVHCLLLDCWVNVEEAVLAVSIDCYVHKNCNKTAICDKREILLYEVWSKTSDQTVLADYLTCFPHKIIYHWKGKPLSFLPFRDDMS